MAGRPLSYQGRAELLTLHASERAGAHPPNVAAVRESARVLSIRATSAAVLVAIEDAGTVRLIRAATSDAPELAVLAPSDRAKVAAAVASLHRAGRADGGPHAA